MAVLKRPPDSDDIVERLAQICESLIYLFPDPDDEDNPDVLVNTDFIGQVFREFPLAFAPGDTADTLRAKTDIAADGSERINSFMIDDRSFSQQATLGALDTKSDGVYAVSVKHTFRVWYVYQFAELQSKRRVRRTMGALRKTLNTLPRLGFPSSEAEFVEKHDGLQAPQIFSDMLEGVLVWIAACELAVTVSEPR